MTPPTCRRCNRGHYNFKSCAVAEEEARQPSAPPIAWNRAFSEGWSPWGDRFDNYEQLGGGTLVLKDDGPKAA